MDNNLPDNVDELKKIIKEQENYINELKTILDAYKKLEKITNMEIMEAEKQVRAQEKISEYSIKELKQRDISLRHLLEINKNISSILDKEKLLQNILDAIIESLKAQRGIIYINHRELGGLKPEYYKNITEEEIKKNYFRICRAKVYESAIFKKTIQSLMEEIEDNGNKFTISYLCLPLIYEDNLLGIVYVDIISDMKTFRIQDLDIAQLFCSQAAISLNNVSLYEKIRLQNLEQLKLINIKDQLLESISNKIKNPLDELKNLINDIFNDINNDNEKVNKIKNIIGNLENTISKVLKIQELEREINDIFADKINLIELINFILSIYKDEIAKRNLTIDLSLSKEFSSYQANKTIMRTIFDEVISNSIFYNKQNGKVSIIGYKIDGYLVVDISDTGIGIKPEDIDKIFEQFYRPQESYKIHNRGAGLGLFLVKKFVKYYNGDIEVKSVYGEGSTFTIKLMLI